ncbi:MAG: Cadherin domain protein [candidate division WS6 bacterium OLB20]|uniref:Cadherin domain protein n=1 Tax=candidate division WS6 bacterium OLB20 TaxID=1617426 RepID=A0A136LXX8_9BACT|nr:MAG: Cadherin domain protein [candidate division WS6 bacterium OLB20]
MKQLMLTVRVLISAASLIAAAGVLGPVLAVSKGNDEIYIASPVNNAVVTGVRQISWFMKEADKSDLPFQIDLFSQSCSANGGFFGTIANGTKTASVQGQTYTQSWDTDGPIVNRSSIPDGYYCLRACATFRETPNNFYTLCDKHTVIIGNTNRSPVITSQPPAMTITTGADFTYQVAANDPDGHSLTYVIDKGGDFFLYMNRTTGQIYTNSPINTPGNYDITVTVTDGFGGSATQRFTLNVVPPQVTEPEITFTSPTSDVVITKDNTTVSWTITRVSPSSLTLSYAQDGDDWTQLQSFTGNPGTYDWDITGLESGQYRLRLVVRDNSGNTFEKISEEFTLSNDTQGGEQVPSVVIVSPAEDSVSADRRPVIELQITAPEGTEVLNEDISVTLDGSELSGCDFDAPDFTCEVPEDLAPGRHKITVSVTDSDGGTTVKEWFFSVGDDPDSTPDSVPDSVPDGSGSGVTYPWDNLSGDTLSLALLILCCGLLLLIIPWLAYTLISRRREQSVYAPESYPQTTSYDYSPTYTEPAPLVPNPDVPAYSEPVQTYSPPPVSESFEPSIGSQTVGSEDQFATPEPVTADTGMGSFDSPEVSMPSIYSDDEEIPDWLKSADSDTASSPVGPGGTDMGYTDKVDNDNAKPYGSYGLASQNDQDQ